MGPRARQIFETYEQANERELFQKNKVKSKMALVKMTLTHALG